MRSEVLRNRGVKLRYALQAQTLKSVLFLHVIVIVTSWDNVT
jgi:hypothetical protein